MSKRDKKRKTYDLHALTLKHSTDKVSGLLGMTARCLVDVRRGKSPLTVDDLYELLENYPDFDLAATVCRIGSIRKVKGWNRKSKLTRSASMSCEA